MTGTDLSIVHIASGDLWAGAEVQLYMLARAQRRAGSRVTALVLNPGTLAEKLRAEGITVHVLPEAKLSTARLFGAMFRLLRQTKPDIVHTHRHKENVLGGLAAWLNGIPSLRTAHGAPEFHFGPQHVAKYTAQALETWIGRHLQKRVIAVTPELATRLASSFPRAHIATIGNGIDPDAFPGFAADEGFVPSFSRAIRRVGIVGRLVPVKRVDIFIAAAVRLASDPQFHDVHFFVLGDGPLRGNLESQATPLRERLHFLGNITRIHPYLGSMDALVMCSDHEGMPMTALEAMSLHCPLVAHNVGGLADLMDGGRCGWPVADQDPAAYASVLAQVLSDDPRRTEVLAQAARQVLEKHTADLCARRHAETYLAALGRPARQAGT